MGYSAKHVWWGFDTQQSQVCLTTSVKCVKKSTNVEEKIVWSPVPLYLSFSSTTIFVLESLLYLMMCYKITVTLWSYTIYCKYSKSLVLGDICTILFNTQYYNNNSFSPTLTWAQDTAHEPVNVKRDLGLYLSLIHI